MSIVSTSAFYERNNAAFAQLRARAETLQTQVSTQQRLARSSDDPVAASRLRSIARADEISTTNVANANRANGDLQLADSAIQEIVDNLIMAQGLATQAATGTMSDDQRAAIGEQIANIRGNLIALANTKDSAGHALFGGEGAGEAYTLDADGMPVYAGTASAGELSLGEGQSVTRGVTGPEFLSFTHGGNATDLFAVLGTLADALQGGSADRAGAARDALDGMKAGLDKLTTTQTVIGSRMNWVDVNLARQERLGEMRATEQTAVGEVDPTVAITQLQEIMTVLEASQASFARLAGLSLFDVIS
jgi:flagellar hook-associated protein 3 FlgL